MGKVHNNLFSSFQKTKLMQISGLVIAEKIEQIKKTIFELELMKVVHCIPDVPGSYTSSLVSFKKIFLWANHVLNSKAIGIKQLLVQTI